MNKGQGRRERGNGSFVRNSGCDVFGRELSDTEIKEIASSIDSTQSPEQIRNLQAAESRQSWGKTYNKWESGPAIA